MTSAKEERNMSIFVNFFGSFTIISFSQIGNKSMKF